MFQFDSMSGTVPEITAGGLDQGKDLSPRICGGNLNLKRKVSVRASEHAILGTDLEQER